MKAGWRAALSILGLALAVVSLWQLHSFRSGQDRLASLARESGVLAYEPGLPDGLAREPDPWHARLQLARALFASASAVGSPLEAAEADRSPAAVLHRLELAQRLAASVAVERPSSWEAAMIQGASTYLGWSLRRDRRLITEPEEWEAPLLRSLAVAPGRPEPARFLAAAYLELWPALSRGKKESARLLVARSLRDRRTFEVLIDPWLRTADSRAQAFSAIPRQPWAWERLQQIEARDAGWDGYREARLRWYAALEQSMRANLAEAEARLRGGDEVRAHLLFLSVLQVPPRQRFLPHVESALAQCPAGPGGGSFGSALQAWLDWSLDLCLWKGCPLPEPVLRRLAGLSGPLPPTTAAAAAVLGDNLAEGEIYERRAEEPWSAAWGPYGIVRARALIRRDDLSAAEQALDGLHPAWKRSSPYWTARLALARAAGDGVREAEAVRQLTALERGEWPLLAWTLREPAPRLEVVPAFPSPGLAIEILSAPDAGAAAEVRLDGEVVAIAGVHRGDVITVHHPLRRVPYLLEIEAVSGGQLVPGAVRLLPGPP
jgi:hypothetical protein